MRPFPFLIPVIALSLLVGTTGLSAQTSLPVSGSLSSHASISLITEGPGKDLYLAFGHTAIRVRDPGQEFDLLFNYGTIDPAYFTDPTFVMRFLMGNLRYSLGVDRFEDSFEWDRQTQNRTWVEQELNLTPEQRTAVYRFLLWNARPENRQYQYDFILDNCSSRVPKVLEEVLGPIFSYSEAFTDKVTARQLIEADLADRLPWNILVTLGLGAVADQPLTPREAAFMPRGLKDLYAGATIVQDGRPVPLVKEERVIYTTTAPRPAPNPVLLMLVLWAVAGAVLMVTFWPRKPGVNPTRWWTALPDRLVLGLVGVGGFLSFYLTFFSLHFAARGDFHLLWMWPTHLVMAALPWNARWTRCTRWYWLAAALVLGLSVVLSPWWPQRSMPEVLPLMLVVAARAYGVFRAGKPAKITA